MRDLISGLPSVFIPFLLFFYLFMFRFSVSHIKGVEMYRAQNSRSFLGVFIRFQGRFFMSMSNFLRHL